MRTSEHDVTDAHAAARVAAANFFKVVFQKDVFVDVVVDVFVVGVGLGIDNTSSYETKLSLKIRAVVKYNLQHTT